MEEDSWRLLTETQMFKSWWKTRRRDVHDSTCHGCRVLTALGMCNRKSNFREIDAIRWGVDASNQLFRCCISFSCETPKVFPSLLQPSAQTYFPATSYQLMWVCGTGFWGQVLYAEHEYAWLGAPLWAFRWSMILVLSKKSQIGLPKTNEKHWFVCRSLLCQPTWSPQPTTTQVLDPLLTCIEGGFWEFSHRRRSWTPDEPRQSARSAYELCGTAVRNLRVKIAWHCFDVFWYICYICLFLFQNRGPWICWVSFLFVYRAVSRLSDSGFTYLFMCWVTWCTTKSPFEPASHRRARAVENVRSWDLNTAGRMSNVRQPCSQSAVSSKLPRLLWFYLVDAHHWHKWPVVFWPDYLLLCRQTRTAWSGSKELRLFKMVMAYGTQNAPIHPPLLKGKIHSSAHVVVWWYTLGLHIRSRVHSGALWCCFVAQQLSHLLPQNPSIKRQIAGLHTCMDLWQQRGVSECTPSMYEVSHSALHSSLVRSLQHSAQVQILKVTLLLKMSWHTEWRFKLLELSV